jgi:succinate-semialdehyde dehydrogenase/glutarate-semialdehyde dehydrogenase
MSSKNRVNPDHYKTAGRRVESPAAAASSKARYRRSRAEAEPTEGRRAPGTRAAAARPGRGTGSGPARLRVVEPRGRRPRRPAGLSSVNPATGAVLGTFPLLGAAEVEGRLARAAAAFEVQRRRPVAERAGLLARLADALDGQQDALARVITEEMGKPITAAAEEVAKCARACRHFAEQGPALLADEAVAVEGARARVRYRPLGPLLAVMPWNFPFWQVVRFAGPALLAGNAVLLKHASNVPRCALALEGLFADAGFGDAFQALLVDTGAVPRLIADRRVAGVSLTGSDEAGRHVAREAGAHLRRTVLELGGSDPFVVLPSADLHAAVRTGVAARMVNSGQSCIAAKRFILAEPVAVEFERRFAQAVRRLAVGDPLDSRTQVGPLATPAIRDGVERQVEATVAAGARLVVGGRRREGPGTFYEPTLLADVPPDSPAAREEVFGPVAALFRARDADHALELANATPFGLGASVWTQDAREAERFADEIQAGVVFVNGMVASDPRLPFGGVKRSGYGRELGRHGLHEFANVQTLWVQEAGPGAAQPTE